MTLGKRLLVFSSHDPASQGLTKATADWGCMITVCGSRDELRGKVEGSHFDYVLTESSQDIKQLIADDQIDSILTLPLAEIEKRHIQRVLASTGGNKTRAAGVLGIDTKTLYNKLKSYRSSEELAQKRSVVTESDVVSPSQAEVSIPDSPVGS